MKPKPESLVESVLDGMRCAQCGWCTEIEARRKRWQSFWVGAIVGASLLFAVLAVVHG